MADTFTADFVSEEIGVEVGVGIIPASLWADISGKPFESIGGGLSVDNGALSAIPQLDISAAGNPVIMRGLADDVPFSDIVISGAATGEALTIEARGKNTLDYSKYAATQTKSGVTFTNNTDGTITINGTASGSNCFFSPINNLQIKISHKYYFSGCPEGGSASTYRMWVQGSGGSVMLLDTGNGVIGTSTMDGTTGIVIVIANGVTVDNLAVKPMLIDLTEMYGAGNEPTNVADLSAELKTFAAYSGATYTITPDAMPYTVSDDIRQVGAYCAVLSSAGTLDIIGCKECKAIERIWQAIDALGV